MSCLANLILLPLRFFGSVMALVVVIVIVAGIVIAITSLF